MGLGLYLVIIAGLEVSGSIGPLNPLSMSECLNGPAGAARTQQQILQSVALRRSAGLPVVPAGVTFDPEAVRFGCTFSGHRPALGSPVSLFDITYPVQFERPEWLYE